MLLKMLHISILETINIHCQGVRRCYSCIVQHYLKHLILKNIARKKTDQSKKNTEHWINKIKYRTFNPKMFLAQNNKTVSVNWSSF